MKKLLNISLSLFFLLNYNIGFCQLWPGDVDNNGVVNGVDILYIGQVWHLEGNSRTDTSIDWEAVPIDSPWDGMFANGTNHAFADCNGDGEVDENDIEGAIISNFHGTHDYGSGADDYNNGTPGQDINLTFVPDEDFILDGDEAAIALNLGTEENPVSNFNGITIAMEFTPGLITDNSKFKFELNPNTWLDSSPADTLEVILYKNVEEGKAELTIIKRRDQAETQTSNGHGQLGTFFVIMEDIVVGDAIDTFNIKANNVMLVDENLSSAPVVRDETDVYVTGPDYLSSNKQIASDLEKDIKVSPNPADDYLSVRIPDYADIETVSLMSSVGQEFQLNNYKGGGHFTINLETYPSGIYYLTLKTPSQIINRVVLINK